MARTSSGVAFVDQFLNGGYETDAITTIYGPAGAGKTNFAVIAALACAKQGKKVIFIDTEGGFSVSRLKQLQPNYRKLLDKVMFLRPTSFEEQKAVIEKLKELTKNKIGLIVIDTMTMLYRLQRSFKEDNYNRDLSLQMLTLNEIARKKKIPILLTSQVYTSFDNNKVRVVGGDILLYASKCLLEIEPRGKTRKLKLHKHRSMPTSEITFEIIEKGIKEIKD